MRNLSKPGYAVLAAVVVATTCLLLLSGCSKPASTTNPAENPTPATPATIELTTADNDTTVDVIPGQKIKIMLVANPTTGYTWAIVSAPEFLKSMGEPTFQSEGAEGVVGAGGEQTLEFEVTATGNGELDLGYSRPFEKDVPPTETFKLKVKSK